MPTGYTSHIYDGTEESVKTYLNRVARGIGYYIHQYQDDPDAAPEASKVSDCRWEEVGRDYAALVGLRNMSPGDKQAGYDESKARYEKNYEEMEARYDELRTRYDQFIQDVTDIDFPVDDPEAGEFFKSLRKLALDQLAQAKDADTAPYGFRPFKEIYPTVEDWYQSRVEVASRSLSRSAERLHDELEKVAKQNVVHKHFTEFLSSLDEEVDPESLDW